MSWNDAPPPLVVGEYRIERRIGQGGMGVVYLAESPSGRRVALKIIRGEFVDDTDHRARFRLEIDAARQVSGAFTAAVLGADPDAEPPWMATQYFDAPTLSHRIREKGPLEESLVWRLGRGLAEALRDIHRAGLVHRDLKPSNVLLTDDGPRVIDFGIARVLEAEPLTRTGRILGTVSFMAPEQLSAPRAVGPEADVFALGAVLVYAATGHGPFDGETGTPPIAIAMKIAQEAPDLAGIPPGLRSVIEKCLCKNPSVRPSPDELLALLRGEEPDSAAVKTLLPEAASTAPEDPEGAPETKGAAEPAGSADSPRPRPRPRTFLLTALVVLAAVVAVPMMREGGAPEEPDDGKRSAPSASASPRPPGPLVEEAAATRPNGWAVWERKPTTRLARDVGDRPSCGASGPVLVCVQAGGLAERLDAASGRVVWSKRQGESNSSTGAVVGIAGGTVLVTNMNQEGLLALDLDSGDRLWSDPTADPRNVALRESTVTLTVPHVDGVRIKNRDARTGKVIASRTFPAGAWHDLFDAGGQGMYLLGYQADKGFVTSLAAFDPVTLRMTRKLATFTANPGTPVAADDEAFSFLSEDSSITRVGLRDGTVKRIPTGGGMPGVFRAQGDRIYTGRADGALASYDLRTGRRHWILDTDVESPSRPVFADGRLYTLAADGRIVCVSQATGQLLWRSAERRDPNRRLGNETEVIVEPVVLKSVVVGGTNTGSVFAVAPPRQ
ncbi:protein kinase [Streptomyces sp. NPDC007818]|uniref:serine/threonine-protein kinase n=1 Tax=Streptomyces sp. NPDC007818 TaxID=3364780 RepID=UPI003683D7A0